MDKKWDLENAVRGWGMRDGCNAGGRGGEESERGERWWIRREMA